MIFVNIYFVMPACWCCLTSFVVFVVCTGGFHSDIAPSAPPACLALTVPAVLSHGALPVAIAQVRTSVCKRGRAQGKGEREGQRVQLE